MLRTLATRERIVAARRGGWFAVRILPYRTLDNVIDGVVLTFADATAARKLEETLRSQAGELRQMAESLPSLVWGARPDGRCDYLSRQWVEYTGVPEAEQLGYGWFEQLHPQDRDRARESWRAAIKSGEPLNIELRIRSESGEHRWFKVRSVPIRDSSGAILRWYGTNTDIDDVKASAPEREQASARLAAHLDGISDPFLALDRELHLEFWNGAAERLFQRRRDEVAGTILWDLIPEARGSLLEEQCRLAREQQRSARFELQLQADPYRGRFSVRLYAHANGISLLLARGDDGSPPTPASGGGA